MTQDQTTTAPTLGYLLPPMEACERGSRVVHAAPLMTLTGWWGELAYPRLVSLCGVRCWGEEGGGGPATCRNCLRHIVNGTDAGEGKPYFPETSKETADA